MARSLLVLSLLLVGLASAQGEERTAPVETQDFAGATFLASPGLCPALLLHLPDGAVPRPLSWPLPAGPLVILALPESDPVARQLTQALAMEADGGELAGGWRLLSWHDGQRPISLLLAADSSALLQARHEIDSWLRPGPTAQAEAALRGEAPLPRAGLHIPQGERSYRPPHAVRAFWPLTELDAADIAEVAEVGANRLWLSASSGESLQPQLAAARVHGLEVGITHRDLGQGEIAARIEQAVSALRPWHERENVKRLALDFSSLEPGLRTGPQMAQIARGVAKALGPQSVRELLVLPGARPLGLAPTADSQWQGMVGLALASPGPCAHPAQVDAQDLVAARLDLGATRTPLYFLESWHGDPWSRERAPSLPRRRHADLAEACEGILVLGAQDAIATLARAWDERGAAAPATPYEIRESLPLHEASARRFAQALCERLKHAHLSGPGQAPPWLTRCIQELEVLAANPSTSVLGVPRVPAAVTLDGRLDEAAWAHAVRVPLESSLRLHLLADGEQLLLGATGELPPGGSLTLRLQEGATVTLAQGRQGLTVKASDAAAVRVGAARAVEVAFSRYALQGDAHLGRVLRMEITKGASHTQLAIVIVP